MTRSRSVRTAASVLAVAALLVGAPSVAHAATGESGTIACELWQKGSGRTYSTMDSYGFVPNGKTFSYSWGTHTYRTYYIAGTAPSGSWNLNSQGVYSFTNSYAYCNG